MLPTSFGSTSWLAICFTVMVIFLRLLTRNSLLSPSFRSGSTTAMNVYVPSGRFQYGVHALIVCEGVIAEKVRRPELNEAGPVTSMRHSTLLSVFGPTFLTPRQASMELVSEVLPS